MFLLTFMSASSIASKNESSEDLFAEEELPIVLSATRLRQSQLETPAAVSIIDRTQIEASGARTVVEALRLVPGMNIGYSRGNLGEVSIHGLHTEFSRRLQVLVDGRSIFKPGLSRVLWANLPFDLDDIERIEVVRGPNSATYGANAFLGVVNIITRHPSDVESNRVSVSAGNHGIRDAALRVAQQTENTSYRISVGHRQDDGFDLTSTDNERFDKNDTRYLSGDFAYHPDVNQEFRITFGHSDGRQQIDLLDDYALEPYFYQKVEDSFLHLNWQNTFENNHELNLSGYYAYNQVNEEWETCPPTFFMTSELGALYNADAVYTQQFIDALLIGQSPPTPPSLEVAALAQSAFIRLQQVGTGSTCGQANQNFEESKFELELQDTWTINQDLRLVSGLNLRKDRIKGKTFFEGSPKNTTERLFANLEWRVQKDILLNLGVMYEHDDYIGGETSPRFALNYLANAHSAFRYVWAKGTRTPDFYEQVGHRNYEVSNLQTPINGSDSFASFYLTPQSSGNLVSETVTSNEIGWHYSKGRELDLDIKVFEDKFENIIDGLFGLDDFNPMNAVDMRNRGVDLNFSYHINNNQQLWLSYSYLDMKSTRGRSLARNSNKQTVSALYSLQFSPKTKVSFAYYLQDKHLGNHFERVDMKLGQELRLAGLDLNLELIVQHNLNDEPFFSYKNAYNHKTHAFLRASVQF